MAYERYGYNTYKYGNNQRFYGVPGSPIANRLWSIEIDRDGDGSFNGDNEAFYCTGMDIDRGFLDEFDDKGNGVAEHFAPPMVGRCTLTMDNSTGRYNLWDASGNPSTDNLPGRRARIRVREGYTGTDRDVFYGLVKDITNDPVSKTASILIHDTVEVLQERRAKTVISTTDASYPNFSYPTMVPYVLENIGWEFGSTDKDGSVVGDAGTYFACDDSAYRVIHQLVKVEDNIFYVNAGGELVTDYVNAIGLPSTSNTFDESILLKPVYLSQPWENIFTNLRVYTYARSLSATDQVIWTKETDLDLSATGSGGTNTFLIDYRYDDSTISSFMVISPYVDSSDFTVNTASDGSGSDISADCTVTLADLGKGAAVTLTNNNASTGYWTSLQLRGQVVYWRRSYRDTSLTNWADFPDKTFVVDTPYAMNYQSPRYAYFQYLGYPHTTKRITVKLRNREEQFWQDINSVTYFTIAKPKVVASSASHQYRILRIRHKWMSENGQDVETEWTCRHSMVNTPPA